ncbi:hypothetical protein LEP1GSC194_1887 [Leptospira alstonii serovar Sichuan str. 79601]|uniref:Uncharacterized protein n=1 Tax=Leptospira alstonii serovar Sichuan str. 79601 TaxID=1218565 RepID=M6D3I9_9LEPT|nr:hypothetical protein LEP1GSC194_1887 [Leptospira alstonii serovar Sichuan str. 79601]
MIFSLFLSFPQQPEFAPGFFDPIGYLRLREKVKRRNRT